MAIMYNVCRRPKLYTTTYIQHQNGRIFQEKRANIYLELKNISRVVCFALSLLIFCRWPRSRPPASMKSSAPSVPTRRQSSSSFRHASIIPMRDGGTTSGSSSLDGLPSPGAPWVFVTVWAGWTVMRPQVLWQSILLLALGWLGWGRVSIYAYTVFQSKKVRFSRLGFSIGRAEVFRVSFDGPGSCLWPSLGCWTGCFCRLRFHSSFGIAMEGRETTQNDLKTIQMPKKIDSDVILT